MQNEIKESIWAAGCPKEVKEEYKLSIKELLLLAVDFVVKQFAVKNGFKIEQAKASVEYLPNIVMKKNDKLYAVAVVPFVYPNYGYLKDEARINMVKLVKGYNATPLFAPIGFKSIDSERANAGLALKGDLFDIIFRGFLVLTEEENQKMIVDNKEFTLLKDA